MNIVSFDLIDFCPWTLYQKREVNTHFIWISHKIMIWTTKKVVFDTTVLWKEDENMSKSDEYISFRSEIISLVDIQYNYILVMYTI